MKRFVIITALSGLSLWLTACHPAAPHAATTPERPPTTLATATAEPPPAPVDACSLILVPHEGTGKTDQEIIRLQQKIRSENKPGPWIEGLGWAFITKARESFDPGYYKLAEQCAFCLDAHEPHSLEAMLLRGHVLQNLHRFKEAEPLARALVAQRGLAYDYGLLGDVLMEQGRLDEAVEAYQKMVDQKPDMQAYIRIANVRWLKGDLAGATEVMQLAAGAASPNAPEAAAWVNTRLAYLKFLNGEITGATENCGVAVDYQKDYAPALLLQGRLLLAQGSAAEAAEVLERAAQLNPLPDYQWVLSEALQACGRDNEARQVADEMSQQAATTDPRTYALYLATSGQSPALALELARNELKTRSDVFTHDALAWALAANGQNEEAWQEMQSALAEGTQDPRLYLHATVLAAKAGHAEAAQTWMNKAAGLAQLLLPSERKQLQQTAASLGQLDQEEAPADTTFNSGG
ncbi:MAG: tetratricopeptide repeat protein [Verrucomicrobiae bacterium]|nr:tetratricopeptide repeat protein [Verrucomicrobiae bacterium]